MNVLVALLILAIGIVALLRVYPVIDRLSGRAETYVSLSMIADKVFTVIEKVYGDEDGPEVPSSLSGVDPDFPKYGYSVLIEQEKAGLYRTEVEIARKEEGKIEKECFYGSFYRK